MGGEVEMKLPQEGSSIPERIKQYFHVMVDRRDNKDSEQ